MSNFKHTKHFSLIISFIAFGLVSNQAYAEPHPGKVLFDDANCMQCHAGLGFKIGPNPKMKVTDKASLTKTVGLCNSNLNLGLFDDEIEHIADYLNQEYYKY